MAISGNTIAHEALVDQNAVDWRRQFQRMLGYDFVAAAGVGAGGVARSGDCAVSQRGAGANMSVDVAAGFIAVGENSGGTGATGTAGVWTGYNDAVLNVPIAASDPSNPRIDRIGFGIRDAAYSGATNDGQITVIAGTPAGVPAAPVIPASYIAWVDIAQVAVAAGAASIINANITDKRQRLSALGGIVVCTSTTRPTTNLWEGLAIYETDTDILQVYDGAAWNPAGQYSQAWTLISEVVRGSTGAIQFAAIPQTFTDLRLEGVLRTSRAVAQDQVNIRLNGDTGGNYDTQVHYGSNATSAAAALAAQTSGQIGNVPGANAVANVVATFEAYIPRYRATTFHKQVRGLAGFSEATAANNILNQATVRWRNTAAITQIDLVDAIAGSTFIAGSSVALLGRR